MPIEKCSAVPIQKCSAQVHGSRLLVTPARASRTSSPFPILNLCLLLSPSFLRSRLLPTTRLPEPVALPRRLQQVTAVCQSIQGRSHKALIPQHLCPALEGQVRRHDHAGLLV